MAVPTAVIIMLAVVVTTVHKCRKRLQGIADFMSEYILLQQTLTLQSNCSLLFSEKLQKAPKSKQVYLHTKQLQSFCCASERNLCDILFHRSSYEEHPTLTVAVSVSNIIPPSSENVTTNTAVSGSSIGSDGSGTCLMQRSQI